MHMSGASHGVRIPADNSPLKFILLLSLHGYPALQLGDLHIISRHINIRVPSAY